MRIKFLKNYGIKEGQGSGPHYAAGTEYEFNGTFEEGYARAYIERGFAAEVVSLGDRPLGVPLAAEEVKADAEAAEAKAKAKADADAKATDEKKAVDAKDAKKK